jgi:hypothetical protein
LPKISLLLKLIKRFGLSIKPNFSKPSNQLLPGTKSFSPVFLRDSQGVQLTRRGF